jgi:hypothetical protein
MSISIMTFNIMPVSIMTFNIMTVSIMTFNIPKSNCDTQHYDIQHNKQNLLHSAHSA